MPCMATLSNGFAILAAALTLIAFAVDIALLVHARSVFNSFGAGISTQPAPGSSTSYPPPPRLLLLRPSWTYLSFTLFLNRFLVGLSLSLASSNR
jgi:hypothetical protein